ncbi:MAG: prepilin-type N-terminal cleavage/methylation domain-containing protein [Myxococcota bacterium]
MQPTAHRHRRRRSGGFSLLEVVIAIGILSFGLLGLALMQVHALTQGRAGRHTGDAAAVARTYIEQVHRIPWAVLTPAVGAGWQNPAWASAPPTWNNLVDNPAGGTSTEHSYGIQWRVSAIGGTACVRDVEIQVNWTEENFPAGKQVVLATRRYDWGGATC